MNPQRVTILCVDDEPLNLSLLEAMLIPRGYDVITAANGAEALRRIESDRVDICLLDVMMPGMDGFEVCRRIKADEASGGTIPVVLITALSDRDNRIRGIEAGAEDFISKPFDAGEVLARINMLVKVKTLHSRLDSAYHTIGRLRAFGEQAVTGFDPLTFDFPEKVDSIVHLLMSTATPHERPETVLVGMVEQPGVWQWRRYDSAAADTPQTFVDAGLDRALLASPHNNATALLYNSTNSDCGEIPLVNALKGLRMAVLNMVSYQHSSFCLVALNYGRDVTIHDAAVVSSVAMQSLFLRSLAAQVRDTESAFEYTVLALARASEANDEDTGDHILRVGSYCALLARHLKLSEHVIQTIRLQAALHDVGKIHVSAAILKKPDKLTAEEWCEMKLHTLHGSKIIGGHQRMSIADRIALSHHERYDGSGYPYGLSGEQIPIEGRILNLADQYDALRNARCYKPAFDHMKTFHIITDGDGRTLPQHFDPQVLAAFREIHESFARVFEAKHGEVV
jgi:response regulator RpfG family c-di-GMP phosphodiesterase